jgi:hypothetical protein
MPYTHKEPLPQAQECRERFSDPLLLVALPAQVSDWDRSAQNYEAGQERGSHH